MQHADEPTTVVILGSQHEIKEKYEAFKIEVLARMLAGYDEPTWGRLKATRKRTYRHAASNVMFGWDDFKTRMKEWGIGHGLADDKTAVK